MWKGFGCNVVGTVFLSNAHWWNIIGCFGALVVFVHPFGTFGARRLTALVAVTAAALCCLLRRLCLLHFVRLADGQEVGSLRLAFARRCLDRFAIGLALSAGRAVMMRHTHGLLDEDRSGLGVLEQVGTERIAHTLSHIGTASISMRQHAIDHVRTVVMVVAVMMATMMLLLLLTVQVQLDTGRILCDAVGLVRVHTLAELFEHGRSVVVMMWVLSVDRRLAHAHAGLHLLHIDCRLHLLVNACFTHWPVLFARDDMHSISIMSQCAGDGAHGHQ